MYVRAGAKDPLLEMRGRQVRWKCAQVPPRAVKSTISAFFVRSDAPKGIREYDLEHFCSLRCPKGTWKVGSGRHGVTHFHKKYHRRPFGRKCVRRREEKCALEGPGRQVRDGTALRTSGECATESHLGGSALEEGRRKVPRRAWEAGSATERALTASQSRGHGERFGGESAHRVPKSGTR